MTIPFLAVPGGRALSFLRARPAGSAQTPTSLGPQLRGLSVGETAAPPQVENVGGGRTPPKVSHRKDQPGRLGIEEKISQPSHLDSADIRENSRTRILIEDRCHFKLLCSQNLPIDPQILVRSLIIKGSPSILCRLFDYCSFFP